MRQTEPYTIEKPVTFQSYKYSGPFEKAIRIADHYGFKLIEPLSPAPTGTGLDDLYVPVEEKMVSMGYYQSSFKDSQHPILVCHTQYSKRKRGRIKLEVFGCPKSIAEALLLNAAIAILKEHGHKKLQVKINSLGNKESQENFMRDFTAYYRKNLGSLGECCQTEFRNNMFDILHCTNQACATLKERAPRSIEYLMEDARTHLMEILEYLETSNIPYELDNDLIGHNDLHSRTIFQVASIDTAREGFQTIVARGDRYDYVARKLHYRKPIPAACISIDVEGGKSEQYKKIEPKKKISIKVHYIHVGIEAKRKSLSVIENLRQANIPIYQSLVEDSLATQITLAERERVAYTVIMGVKEAKEESVIVRNMETQAQEVVGLTELPRYIKSIV